MQIFGEVISLPACGITCLKAGFSATKCSEGDYSCLCSDPDFISAVASCLVSSCDAADTESSESYAANLCETRTDVDNLSLLESAVAAASTGRTVSSSIVPESTTITLVTATAALPLAWSSQTTRVPVASLESPSSCSTKVSNVPATASLSTVASSTLTKVALTSEANNRALSIKFSIYVGICLFMLA